MVHSAHCYCHADALVDSMYTQDEGLCMGIHIHREIIGQAQRRLKYDSRSTLIDPLIILYDGNDGYLGGRVASLPILYVPQTETTED